MEKLFYNSTFLANNRVLTPTESTEQNKIYTYGQLLDEIQKRQIQQPYNIAVTALYDKLTTKDLQNRGDNIMTTTNHGKKKFQDMTEKIIYEELLLQNYRDHHHTAKWVQLFNTPINWKNVWHSVHNPLSTEDTKSLIWEQIHLNMYTTSSYNKGHKSNEKCPLCTQIPQSEFYNILECQTVKNMWKLIEPHLVKIHPAPVTPFEMAFGLPAVTKNEILGNWLTFLLREIVSLQERPAYHNKKGHLNELDIKLKFNEEMKRQLLQYYILYKHLGKEDYFRNSFAINDYIITWEKNQWQVLTIFPCGE